jgi:hypothetical protein
MVCASLTGLLSLFPVFFVGQNEETFCSGRDDCIPDSLEVVFLENALEDPASVFEYQRFQAGRSLDVEVILDAATKRIQGWAYGVAHDDRFLELVGLSTEGTIAHETCHLVFPGGVDPPAGGGGSVRFCVTRAVPGGWISAVIPDGNLPSPVLVGERNPLALARYSLVADAGPDGTRLRLVDGEIGPPGSPPVEITITVDGRAGRPSTLTHGQVRAARGPFFQRGDADGDGRSTVADAIITILVIAGRIPQPYDCPAALDADADGKVNVSDAVAMLRWLFRSGPGLPAPFRRCGSAPEDEVQSCDAPSPSCPP